VLIRNSNYADTLKNTKYLINVLLARHKLTIDNVYRHYDITAKDCPIMYQPNYVEMQYFDWSWITFKEYVRSSS
jgi:N-acetylmuramoyl-L-alanine amidase CwlA